MNGFANTLLSFLLSWIRTLVDSLWALLGSEDGGMFYRFLAEHWLTVLIVLCIGGFVIDRIVYFIRWRPYYVWQSRLRRLRKSSESVEEAPWQPMEPVPAVDHSPYQRPLEPELEEPVFDEPVEEWNDPPANDYYRDMEAGYAPPVPPQQLYAPRAQQTHVHPGLDEETFRQNLGLTEERAPRRRRAIEKR